MGERHDKHTTRVYYSQLGSLVMIQYNDNVWTYVLLAADAE